MECAAAAQVMILHPQTGHGGVWSQPCRPRLLAGRSLSSAALSWSDDDVYRLARALASWHRACFLVSSTLDLAPAHAQYFAHEGSGYVGKSVSGAQADRRKFGVFLASPPPCSSRMGRSLATSLAVSPSAGEPTKRAIKVGGFMWPGGRKINFGWLMFQAFLL